MESDSAHSSARNHIATDSRPVRWMLLAAGFVAVCITGFVVFNTREMAQAQQDSWRLTMQTQLDGVVEQAGRWLTEREEGAKAAASFEPVVVLYGRLRGVAPRQPEAQAVQWRADLKALLAPTLNRNGIVGYVMTTRDGQVLADSGLLAGQVLDAEDERALLRQTLSGPRYAHVTLPQSWSRSLAFNQAGPVILAAAAIWPRGPELEPGVLLLVIDPRAHFEDIFSRARTGKSGETYAISGDGRFASPSRFESETAKLGEWVSENKGSMPAASALTRAAQDVILGRTGADMAGYRDYRGVEVIGLWRWEPHHRFGVITEVDTAEAYASIRSIRRQSLWTIASTLFLIGSLLVGFTWWSRRMAGAQAQLQAEHQEVNRLAAVSRGAEQAIRERESHLRMLLDHFPGYMSITDKQNRYVYINRELADILGQEPEAVVGRHFREVLDAKTADELEAAFALPPGQRLKSDYSMTTHGGRRVRHLERHRIVGPDHDGGAGVNFSFGFDITHAKRGQELEAFRSQAMEMITSGAPLQDILLQLVRDVEAMLLTSMGSVQLVDERCLHFTHCLSQSMPAGFNDALKGLKVGEDMGSFGVAAATGRRCAVDNAQAHPAWAGLPGLAEAAGVCASWSVPITSQGQQILGTLTVCHATPVKPDNLDFYVMDQMARLASVAIERDRTASRLKDQEATLRKQQRQLQKAIDNMLDGFVRARMDDTLVVVNDALVTMLGYGSREELLGRPSKELYARHEDWEHLVATLMSGRQLRNFRGQARRKDGELIWVEISSHLDVDAASELSGIEAVVRDITQQIEFENALKDARNAAQAAADARGSFLANMSHEIRTPMNAIIGLTELALRTDLTPRQQDYLGKVSQAANNLLGILNDILDFSKIESGRLDLEAIPFNLDDVLGQLASVMDVQVEKKGLELRFDRQPGLPVHLVGDPLRLGQVLTNLANNANKFTETGQIVVTVQVVEQQAGRVTLRFAVQDSGIGMTPEQMSRLFQPFSQADESTTRRFGGTGLGLAISRQLVEMMGGRIWVESEPGVGSNFLFEVELGLAEPMHSGEDGAPRARPGGDASAQDRRKGHRPRPDDPQALARIWGARVLLVEDNAINQQVATELLEQAGLVVEVARHGQEALDRLAHDAFDVVLMDLQMPVMDGYTATAEIRKNPAWKDLPVLAMTANAMAEDRVRVQEAGMNAHIAKPVVPAELFKALLRWVPHTARAAQGAPASTPSADTLPALPTAAEPSLPAALPGLDVATALANVGGNRKLLRKLLADLVQDHAQDVQVLKSALAEGDMAQAQRAAHTLKGVAGTLGARGLQQAAEALDRTLREAASVPSALPAAPTDLGHAAVGLHTALNQQLDAMQAELQPLMDRLATWGADEGLLQPAPAPSITGAAAPARQANATPWPPLDAVRLDAALQALDKLLSEFDPEAAERAQALAAQFGPQAPALQELAQLSAHFDFEAARTALLALRAALPGGGRAAEKELGLADA